MHLIVVLMSKNTALKLKVKKNPNSDTCFFFTQLQFYIQQFWLFLSRNYFCLAILTILTPNCAIKSRNNRFVCCIQWNRASKAPGVQLICSVYLCVSRSGLQPISVSGLCSGLFQVTKLDRDPASGTALQEIGFWLNLERALNRIQEKRESPEVLLTLDILKHGKRFHATVSFDTDTGERALWAISGR